ncbi:MAG TPA: aldo/keto reductase [Ktedonobacteraceae bacterium]|nr:aldo/keto reductase [Ktedonobacteraceae bacterium]
MTTSLPVKRVGHTALEVSVIGLGSAPIGGMYRTVSQEQVNEMVQYALSNGIRFIDTAPFYGEGQAERYLGAALAQVSRTNYVLSSKVGRLITPEGKVVFDFSRDGVLRSVEESLQRLQLDYIDILLVHDPDDHYRQALDGAFPALVDLRRQGVIKAIGAGMNQWQMEADFARNVDVDCFLLAGRYTLLEQGAIDEFFPLCLQKGIGVFLGGVFNSGILASGPRPGAKYNYQDAPAEIVERVRRIEAVCTRFGVPLRIAAAQFPLAHPAVTALVLGAESVDEVAANLQALHTPIPAELWDALRHEGLLHEAAPIPH